VLGKIVKIALLREGADASRVVADADVNGCAVELRRKRLSSKTIACATEMNGNLEKC
jgi:hypothetical protein